MTYNTINTDNVKPEMDFEEIQKDLAKFKNHAPKREVDAAKLLRYMDKFERLIFATSSYKSFSQSSKVNYHCLFDYVNTSYQLMSEMDKSLKETLNMYLSSYDLPFSFWIYANQNLQIANKRISFLVSLSVNPYKMPTIRNTKQFVGICFFVLQVSLSAQK